ncbi:hypothetical protein K1719_038962 [Acacia pycnantha]|nr:hypothetical protein K1719_038962 [Acacia pycnantha]
MEGCASKIEEWINEEALHGSVIKITYSGQNHRRNCAWQINSKHGHEHLPSQHGGILEERDDIMDQDYMNHSLHLTVDALRGEIQYNCQIDVKPWHFWIKKG